MKLKGKAACLEENLKLRKILIQRTFADLPTEIQESNPIQQMSDAEL